MIESIRRWLTTRPAQLLLWLVLPLAIGILLATQVPQPVIGIIYLKDAIYSYSAQDVIAQIAYAREHPEVKAVVLVLDSPGGTVADTETLYLEFARLRKDKPVVTVVESMAASGGYYLAVGTDYIFVKPTSDVGNVGVRVYLPSNPTAVEEEASTGPFKFTGGSRDSVLRSLEPIKEQFYRAVVLGRGDALKASEDQILSGELYLGTDAVKLGLVDAIGTQTDGAEKAASLAHVWNFAAKDLRVLAGLPSLYGGVFFIELENGVKLPYPKEAGTYLLYIPPVDRRLP